jgi:hypothetical protein
VVYDTQFVFVESPKDDSIQHRTAEISDQSHEVKDDKVDSLFKAHETKVPDEALDSTENIEVEIIDSNENIDYIVDNDRRFNLNKNVVTRRDLGVELWLGGGLDLIDISGLTIEYYPEDDEPEDAKPDTLFHQVATNRVRMFFPLSAKIAQNFGKVPLSTEITMKYAPNLANGYMFGVDFGIGINALSRKNIAIDINGAIGYSALNLDLDKSNTDNIEFSSVIDIIHVYGGVGFRFKEPIPFRASIGYRLPISEMPPDVTGEIDERNVNTSLEYDSFSTSGLYLKLEYLILKH